MGRKRWLEWLVLPALLALTIGAVYGAAAVAALGTTGSTSEASVHLALTAATATPESEDDQAVTELEERIISVYEAASPAVVNITNRSYVTYRFMGTVPEEGSGSGFLYDTEGHVVTNYHVIEGADELLVTLATGQVYEAEVVGSDPTNDLAVLHIDAVEDLPEPLVIGDSDALRVGQFVLAIGNPFGIGQTLTTGVISALGRVIESPEDNRFIGEAIQTDAAINPGNSGGPMLDLRGRVIGVNSQIISTGGDSAGVGFAVSASTVRRVVPQLIDRGYYAHPWLGADMLPLTPSVAKVLRDAGADISMDMGLLVLQTTAGGPADEAGIRGGNSRLRLGRYYLLLGGDIITAVNGVATDDLQALTVYLETQTEIGEVVDVTYLRDGVEHSAQITLGEQPMG
jgi:S1-C subfamily serine protease